jgi:hypothetical protein
MRYIDRLFWILNGKMDNIIEQLNNYTGDILVAIIGAIALIGSVIIGSKTIGKRLSEDQIKSKLQKVEENNRSMGYQITEILLKIKTVDGPLHYKNVEKFYLENIIPLYKNSMDSSMEVCTGCYIVERLTNFLLKFRIPYRYPKHKGLRKVSLVDNNYFAYIANMLNLILFYTKGSITVPNKLLIKKRIVDHIQNKLGGPKNNYSQNNILTTISGINYDTRFHLYSNFFDFVARQGNDTARAFVNIVDEKIIFITSKYIMAHKIYAPLYFKIISTVDDYPYLYLSGIKFMHSLGNTKNSTIQLIYISTLNWFYFEEMINKKLLETENVEYFYEKLDREFIKKANVIGISTVAHTIRVDIQRKYSDEIFKKNKGKIVRKYKKLHDIK